MSRRFLDEGSVDGERIGRLWNELTDALIGSE
jgi:hypothetical protein